MLASRNFRAILLDMDDVLYTAGRPIPGAIEAVQWMPAQSLPHLFVTNTSSRPRAALAEELLSFGFPAAESQILTPATAAADWLRASAMRGIALFVPPQAQSEFAGLPCLPDDAESGVPFAVALEHAAGRKAMVFGKPAADFFRTAAGKVGLPAEQILMAGDDVETGHRRGAIGGSESGLGEDRQVPAGGSGGPGAAGSRVGFHRRAAQLVDYHDAIGSLIRCTMTTR